MIRLWLCILILGGTVAFLSCSDSPDGNGGGAGKGGGGGGGTTGVAGRGGTGGGIGPCDGLGTGCGGRGGTTGVAGTGGTGGSTGCLGTGCGGRGGTTGVGGCSGTTGVGGRGGTGGICTECCGTGCGGRGGSGSGPGGTGGGLAPCDGIGYFEERGWCAPTYAAQAAKQIAGDCDYVRVFTGSCGSCGGSLQVWTTRYTSLGDPLLCAYNSAGDLAAARICTDTTMPAWNCNGASTAPACLSVGFVPDIQACPLTTTCDATGGRGGSAGGT